MADLVYTHVQRDEVLTDPETGETWEVLAWITCTVVDGVEHSIVTTTSRDVPAGMSPEAWTDLRQQSNEVALAHQIGPISAGLARR